MRGEKPSPQAGLPNLEHQEPGIALTVASSYERWRGYYLSRRNGASGVKAMNWPLRKTFVFRHSVCRRREGTEDWRHLRTVWGGWLWEEAWGSVTRKEPNARSPSRYRSSHFSWEEQSSLRDISLGKAINLFLECCLLHPAF